MLGAVLVLVAEGRGLAALPTRLSLLMATPAMTMPAMAATAPPMMIALRLCFFAGGGSVGMGGGVTS
jgi:hypothetical protein